MPKVQNPNLSPETLVEAPEFVPKGAMAGFASVGAFSSLYPHYVRGSQRENDAVGPLERKGGGRAPTDANPACAPLSAKGVICTAEPPLVVEAASSKLHPASPSCIHQTG